MIRSGLPPIHSAGVRRGRRRSGGTSESGRGAGSGMTGDDARAAAVGRALLLGRREQRLPARVLGRERPVPLADGRATPSSGSSSATTVSAGGSAAGAGAGAGAGDGLGRRVDQHERGAEARRGGVVDDARARHPREQLVAAPVRDAVLVLLVVQPDEPVGVWWHDGVVLFPCLRSPPTRIPGSPIPAGSQRMRPGTVAVVNCPASRRVHDDSPSRDGADAPTRGTWLRTLRRNRTRASRKSAERAG